MVTIHDATFFTEPELHTAVKGTFFRSATRTALRRATRVIVPSKATRDELVRVLDADPTKLDVAYHGVDPEIFHPPDRRGQGAGRRPARPARRPTSRSSASSSRARTCPNLIRGWVKAVHWRDEPPALVLAGGSGWDEDVDAAIAEVPAHLRVIRPGYLRFADLPGYLGGATVVAFPSHGEGFGLPVLEAMACGAPVLTTHRLSLPEVGGDAVAYTEPGRRRDRDRAPRAARRRGPPPALAEAAITRAREFTWAVSAEAHMASYARAAQQG